MEVVNEVNEKEKQRYLFQKLYNSGYTYFTDYFPEYDTVDKNEIDYRTFDPNYTTKPKVTPIRFDPLYDTLFEDVYKESEPQFSKIIQYGNFGVTQPSGGYLHQHYISKPDLIDQYKRALGKFKPALMVITDPNFQDQFFVDNSKEPDLYYKEMKRGEYTCGVLYNPMFDCEFKIEDLEDLELGPSLENVTLFKITKTENPPILVSNFHGTSNENNLSHFKEWIEWCNGNGIHYITGDSHMISLTNNSSIGDTLTPMNLGPMAYSTIPIRKQKKKCDILWNHEIRNTERRDEIDGRFVVELRPSVAPSDALPLRTSSNPIMALTRYSDKTPILADQNVVRLKSATFNLLSATSFYIGSEEEWGNFTEFDIYHTNYGRRYTTVWILCYNDWIKEFNRVNGTKLEEFNMCHIEADIKKSYEERIRELKRGSRMNQLKRGIKNTRSALKNRIKGIFTKRAPTTRNRVPSGITGGRKSRKRRKTKRIRR